MAGAERKDHERGFDSSGAVQPFSSNAHFQQQGSQENDGMEDRHRDSRGNSGGQSASWNSHVEDEAETLEPEREGERHEIENEPRAAKVEESDNQELARRETATPKDAAGWLGFDGGLRRLDSTERQAGTQHSASSAHEAPSVALRPVVEPEPVEIQLPAGAGDQIPAVENLAGIWQENQIPEHDQTFGHLAGGQMPAKQIKDLGQIPVSFGQMPADDWDVDGLWSEPVENQMPAGGLWAELWRAEKDGRGNYRFALRFVKEKIRRAGGTITPAVERWLAGRKGKGRHQSSRDEALQLRGFAEYLAGANLGNSSRRHSNSDTDTTAGAGDLIAGRNHLPDLQRLAGEDLPDVRGGFVN